MKALVIGDLSISITARTRKLPKSGENLVVENPSISPSGVAANISSNLRGLGVDTYVSGAVGEDVFGDTIIRELNAWGVRTQYVRRSGKPTSVFMLIVDREGERTMIGYRGASETVRLDSAIVEKVKPDWVHISGYTLLNPGVARELGPFLTKVRKTASVSLDLEGVAHAKTPLDLDGVRVFCNLEEYRVFFGTERISHRGDDSTLVVKAGARGSYLVTSYKVRRFAAFKTRVEDTNGAGDAFNAAFIAAKLDGLSDKEACRWGNAAGSLKVSQSGPHPAVLKEKIAALARKG